MVYTVFYKEESYQLPESMRCLSEYQDDSMKYRGSLTLYHVKIIEMLIRGEECGLPYKLFIGVMPTNRNSKIIIVGEYFLSYPSDYGSFRHIEVPNSEMINFVCDLDSDSDSDSDSGLESGLEYFNIEILELENNLYAILLKTGVIIIGITPVFQTYLDENVEFDEGNYDDGYLYVKRFNFVHNITDFPFNRSSIDCCDLRFNETMTSCLEKNDGGSRISLDFTRTCRCSDDDCLTKVHWKTENSCLIYISNEEIRIVYTRYTTTYDRYIVDGHFNDRPTMRTEEKDDNFHDEMTYKLFSEDD